MQHNTLQGSRYSENLTAPKIITAWGWQTNVLWKNLYSILLAELLPTKVSHKDSTDPCQFLEASFASTWAQLLADQCAQYVDDIGIAANNATHLTRNIRAVFKCIRQAGLKLTIEMCHFRLIQIEFLRGTISPEGVSPQAHKIQNFPNK